MMKHIATIAATLVAILGLAGGCAMPVDSDSPSDADRASAHTGEGLYGIESTSGITDAEVALEAAGGSTDEAAAPMPAAPTSPKASKAVRRVSCAQGTLACNGSSTGAGVHHGSPQPLDPRPADSTPVNPL